MPYQKKIKIITAFLFINLTILPLTGYAQTATQSASIQVTTAANVVSVSSPLTLQMPSAFSFPEEDNSVYKAFSPDDTSNKIRISDTRNAGGFLVDLSATDFTDGTQAIPYQNLGIVTLSGTDHPLSINYDGINTPLADDSGTINAPLHCSIISEEIPDNDPPNEVSGVTTIEECETYGQGFMNLTGTGATSNPLLIIDGQNPTTGGRTGSWFIGLGVRLTVPPALDSNTYNSTITITLTQT